MKVLFVSSSSGSRGGGELFLLYLARALSSLGHECVLWASDHSRMDELAALFAPVGQVIRRRYRNTYDSRFRSLRHLFDFGTSRELAAEWRSIHADVVHVNKQNLEDGLDLLRAAEVSGLPNVVTIHITQPASYLRARGSWTRDKVARWLLKRNGDLLVSVFDERQDDLLRFLGPDRRLRLVRNGVPLFDLAEKARLRECRRRELGISGEERLAIAVGRVASQKRPLVWLDWAERLREADRRWSFLWLGDGALAEEFDAVVQRRGMGDFVRRIPWTTDVYSYLAASDVFMHTAEFEGLALAILEAMSAALPIVVTENLARELPFLGHDNSMTLDGGLPLELLRASDADLLRKGQSARAIAERDFSFDRMAREYEDLYSSVIAEHRRGA